MMGQAAVSERFRQQQVDADVIVVGAGPAGLCAAVAAARNGCRTLLMTDRPVLGGSASVEVGVPMNGAAYSPFNLWARETGMAEEIRNRHAACWSGRQDSYWTAMDRVYWDLVHTQENLEVLLNVTVFAAESEDDGIIQAIHGLQLRAENVFHVSGRMFIDCTGDGTLGYLAGAESRQGREARSEFGESLAPATADGRTMGTTLLWRSRDVGKPAPFKRPDWAIDVSELPSFARPGEDLTRTVALEGVGGFHGLWWAEYGGQIDTLHDDQKVLLHTRALVYGIWDWIKNSGKVTNVANQELVHVATLGGKRESRRLMGLVILTENNWREQTRFADAVCYTGWPIDVHPPRGYLDSEPGCTHIWLPGPSDIPLRALYSRNVANLFFAGRCFSATHTGLGSPRVIATTAVCGQAAGTAAALCLEQGLAPGQLDAEQVRQLQQRLVRTDQGIIGVALEDSDDLAGRAKITASSTRKLEQVDGDRLLILDPSSMPDLPNSIDNDPGVWHSGSAGVLVAAPVVGAIDYVELRFHGPEGLAVMGQLYYADRPENYRLSRQVGQLEGSIGTDGWTRFTIDAPTDNPGAKLLMFLPAQPGVALMAHSCLTPGVAAMRVWDNPDNTLCEAQFSRAVCTPCIRLGTDEGLFAAANVADGHIRPHGLPHQWASEPMQPGRPEWLRLEWPEPVEITRVELVFDSQLNGEFRGSGMAGEMVRQYELRAESATGPVIVAKVDDNILRFVQHRFEPVRTRRLELRIRATYGGPRAALYALRVY